MIFKRRTPLEKEMAKLDRQEREYISSRMEMQDSRLSRLLADKVPQNLHSTLDTAFYKAFSLVFEKGTAVIDKTYNKEKARQDFRINEYTALVKNSRKPLKNVRKNAAGAGRMNLAVSGISGIGLGVLGIGLPDIAIFTSLILKNMYQLATNYGFEYESISERRFILTLIRAAVSRGEKLAQLNDQVDYFIENGCWQEEKDISRLTEEAAGCLSGELLYIKFLQGIPVVGAVGGGYNLVYMKQITKYAEMKYRRRFFIRQAEQGMPL